MGRKMEALTSLLVVLFAASLLGSATHVAAVDVSRPDQAKCAQPGRCYQKTLVCPAACKSRSTLGIGTLACFIDCGDNCQATCKHRKPNCFGEGAMCYDPRLVGGDGTVFYFHGRKDEDFCLISDKRLHVNGHFIGLRPEGRTRDFTWVQAVGVLFGNNKLSVAAKKVSHWDDAVDQLLFSYDGLPLELEGRSGAMWTSEDGQLTLQRIFERNTVQVVAQEMMTMLIQVVPITAEYNKAHNYHLPTDDVFAHLDLQFSFHNLSANVNGVLGETYQPNFVSRAKVGVNMPVLGGEDRFFASGLLNPDCKDSQFSPDSVHEEAGDFLQPFKTECYSKDGSGSGIVCRR